MKIGKGESTTATTAADCPITPLRCPTSHLPETLWPAGIDVAYRRELDATLHFAELFGNCEFEESTWSRDTTRYHADESAGNRWMLVGDASSFVDPLVAAGVEKAMRSAWMGAVVVNTCLRNPAMAEAAIGLFNAHEAETYRRYARRAREQSAEVAAVLRTPFWTTRAHGIEDAALGAEPESGCWRLGDGAKFELSKAVYTRPAPAIREREVVLADELVLPGLGVEYARGVHLPTLAALAAKHHDMASLCTAYREEREGAAIPELGAALSLLVDKGVLLARR